MLTPAFELQQNDEFLTVAIKAPHTKVITFSIKTYHTISKTEKKTFVEWMRRLEEIG